MKRKTKVQREKDKENALKSVFILWEEAKKIATSNPDRARFYVKQIKAIKKHVKIKLPTTIRRGYCKKCFIPFLFGDNATAEKKVKADWTIIKCSMCNTIRRFQEENNYNSTNL